MSSSVSAATANAREPSRSVGRRRVIRWRGDVLFLLPAAIYLLALVIYPFVQLVQMSFSRVTSDDLYHAWPFVGLAEFTQVMATPDFRQALVNTVVYVAIVVAVGLIGGLVAAVILWQGEGLPSFVLGLMIFVWAMPPIVNGSVWKFLLDQHGPIDSVLAIFHLPAVLWLVDGNLPLISVALVNSWISVPFATVVFRAALLDMPTEIFAAAEVDGAHSSQVLRYIVLPLLRPTTLVLGVVTVVYAFRSFDFIYVMTFGGPGTTSTTLPFLSYRLAFEGFKYSLGAATAVISVAIILVLALVYIRQVRVEEGA